MPTGMKLPPGATVVSYNGSDVQLPPGASLANGAPASEHVIKADPKFGSWAWAKEKFYNGADRATNWLPAAGATVGGILGAGGGTVAAPGPGSVGGGIIGATIGGAGGEAGKQLIRRGLGFEEGVPQTSMDAAENIGKEGLKQGAYEAIGAGVGRLGKTVAPGMARNALRIPKAVEDRGADTGKAILEHTTGFRPATIAKQAEAHEANLAADLDRAVTQPGVPSISRQPIVGKVNAALAKTNNPKNISKLEELGSVIREDLKNPATIPSPRGVTTTVGKRPNALLPSDMTPADAVQLRRDINDLGISWQAKPSGELAEDTMKQAYGETTGALHQAVPETAAIDKKFSDIIPVRYYANKAANLKGVTENLLIPKGSSLTTSGAGLGYGLSMTPGGAMLGAVAGRVIPEWIATPTVRMAGARALNSNITPQVIKGAFRVPDAMMQSTDLEKKQKEEEDQ